MSSRELPCNYPGSRFLLKAGMTEQSLMTQQSVMTEQTRITELLLRYAQSRSADHANAHKFTNSLVEFFAHNSIIIKNARRIGLLAAQIIPGIKQHIVARGVGAWE